MADVWVCVRGDLTEPQTTTLEAAGIAVHDLRRISAAFGEPPIEWQTLRTCVRVSATGDAEAKAEIARVLGLDAADLTAYSAEIFR
jgi:hypothetical protein